MRQLTVQIDAESDEDVLETLMVVVDEVRVGFETQSSTVDSGYFEYEIKDKPADQRRALVLLTPTGADGEWEAEVLECPDDIDSQLVLDMSEDVAEGMTNNEYDDEEEDDDD